MNSAINMIIDSFFSNISISTLFLAITKSVPIRKISVIRVQK